MEYQFKEIIPYKFDDIYDDISAKFAEQGYDTSPGSNISQLVTSMSYAVSMLNANTAMNVNEMILPYANRRENILTSARNLAYEAKHKTSYVYTLTLKSKTGTFIIPKYTVFKQGANSYVYMGKQLEIYGTPQDTLSITVKEGTIYKYTDSEALHVFIGKIQDQAGNIVPQYYIDIPFINVEEDGIEVLCTYMDEYGVLHEKEQWNKAPSLSVEVDQDPDVRNFFRIDNIEYGTPRIYFRYSGIGKPLQLGTEVFINILESHGSKGSIDLDNVSSIKCPDDEIEVITAELVSSGADEETDSAIKINAPKLHNSSNRLVVAQDYIAACKRDQRVKNCVVWGGEDEFPKAPGHIWFSFLPPGTHNFTHDDAYSRWTRDNVSYEWEYGVEDQGDQEKARADYFRLNYIPYDSIKSPYRNTDGTVSNPGIWDRLDALKIPTLVYHHRSPIYCEFNYKIEVAKYLAYDSKSSMHTDMFNIIDASFAGGDGLHYEDFDVEYFNSNIIKRVDERASDLSGFNMSLSTNLVLNEKCLAIENLEPEYKDIYIPLAAPFEKYFDSNGFLLIDRLPNIDTDDFVSYLDDGPKGRIFTDWSLVRNDIESNKRQQSHKIIYAPIKVRWSHDYNFRDRSIINKVLLPFEIQPDDYLQTGDPDAQFSFNNTVINHIHVQDGDSTTTRLTYNKDWYWDSDNPCVIKLDSSVDVTEDDILRVSSEAQAGWYYLFNSLKKEVLIHLFVDDTKSGFTISLGGDWSKDPSADLESRYLYSYDDYYGYSEDSYYHYTEAKVDLNDNYTSDEASLSARSSYIGTTNNQPRSFLTTLNGDTLTTIDHWFLTTNGYVITDENDRNSYTGPIIREINKYMYTRSPLKSDLFKRNRYLNLKYLSNSFAFIRNVIPVLKQVEFYSLSDDNISHDNNLIDITLSMQGGETTQDLTFQTTKGITWERLKTSIKDPSKLYSEFKWWSLESYGAKIQNDIKFTNDTTLYAVWKTKTHELTFDGNGGQITPSTMSVKTGTTWAQVEAAVTAKKDGYVIDGFSSEAEGSRIPRDSIITNDASVYVHWAEHKTIVISFNTDGGTPQDSINTLAGTTWAQIKDKVYPPTKEGYVFAGWFYDNIEVTDGTKFINDCVIVATYTRRMTSVKFDMHGSRPVVDTKSVLPGTTWKIIKAGIKQPTKPESIFITWSLTNDVDLREPIRDEFTFDDWDYTVHALFTSNICKIRFASSQGAVQQLMKVVERGTTWRDLMNHIDDPVRPNFKFAGWSLTPDGGPVGEEFTFDAKEITLYATWIYDGTVLAFDSQKGSHVNPMKISRGTTWREIMYNIEEPSRKWYKFAGWSFNPDVNEPIPESYVFDENQYNIYAHWIYNASTIKFNTDGGSFIDDVVVLKGTNWNSVQSLIQPTFKEGYTFSHWALDQNGEPIAAEEVFNDDIEHIWAVWN